LADLTPKGSLVAAETVERSIVEVGEAQKAAPDFGIGVVGRCNSAA
jgi:hypothetical protein